MRIPAKLGITRMRTSGLVLLMYIIDDLALMLSGRVTGISIDVGHKRIVRPPEGHVIYTLVSRLHTAQEEVTVC